MRRPTDLRTLSMGKKRTTLPGDYPEPLRGIHKNFAHFMEENGATSVILPVGRSKVSRLCRWFGKRLVQFSLPNAFRTRLDFRYLLGQDKEVSTIILCPYHPEASLKERNFKKVLYQKCLVNLALAIPCSGH